MSRDVDFDPRRDQINRQKHGISLARARDIEFVVDPRPDPDYADRWQVIGTIDANYYFLVFADLAEGIRAISLRPLYEAGARGALQAMTKRTNRLDFYKSKSTEDPDSPKLTVKDIADFKRPRKVPQHILDAFPKMRGRPPKPLEERKVQITIRLHPLILDHFRSSGPGWQTRMEEVLLDHAIIESEPVVARKYSSGELRSRLAAKKRAAKKSA